MPFSNNLKPQVDIPVWEWCRFAPTTTSAISTMTTTEDGENRFIYYLVGSVFYRYDTYADTWMQLASPNVAPATTVSMRLTMNRGFHGRVLNATSSTITIPGLRGNIFNGKKLRILQGSSLEAVRIREHLLRQFTCEPCSPTDRAPRCVAGFLGFLGQTC